MNKPKKSISPRRTRRTRRGSTAEFRINLEKSFDPQKPRVGASRRHKKHENIQRDSKLGVVTQRVKGCAIKQADFFRVFRAFRGLIAVIRIKAQDSSLRSK